MTELTVGQTLGGYRLEEFAGRGGMGVVYRATQVRLERVVALKVIAPELASDPAFRERFQREARLLASVDDPHVVTVYEAGEADGQLFLSMRWIEGGDLAVEFARSGGLEPLRAQRLLAQVASGLDAVHAHGLVHGDLKPANMLIEPRGSDERAYVSDFGAGRSLEATASGTWLGTVDYVAPETIRGAPRDARSDLYGLACVLFEALTGAPPFRRDTPAATMWAHYSDPVPSACERRPALPRAVDAVLARGLAKDPDERYASGERMLQALSDALLTRRGQPTGPLAGADESTARGAVTIAPEDPDRDGARLAAPRAPAAGRRRRRLLGLGGLLLVAIAIVAGAIAVASSGSSPRRRPPAPATITRTPLGAGTQAIRVTGTDDTAYVLDQFGPYVDVVQSFGQPDRIPLPSKPLSLALDSGRNLLWVGLASHRLLAINLSGQHVIGTVALPLDPTRLAVLQGEVIAEQANPGRMVRVESTRMRVVGAPVSQGGASATSLVVYQGTLLSTTVFPARLEQWNARLQRIADNPIGVALPSAMAVDPGNFVWVTDYDAARVWRLDPASGNPIGSAIPVGQDPTAVAVSGQSVFVGNTGDETVTVINEQSSPVRGTAMPLGGPAGPLAPAGDIGNAWMASGTQLLSIQSTP
jgi:serine/threonine-protein kinase